MIIRAGYLLNGRKNVKKNEKPLQKLPGKFNKIEPMTLNCLTSCLLWNSSIFWHMLCQAGYPKSQKINFKKIE